MRTAAVKEISLVSGNKHSKVSLPQCARVSESVRLQTGKEMHAWVSWSAPATNTTKTLLLIERLRRVFPWLGRSITVTRGTSLAKYFAGRCQCHSKRWNQVTPISSSSILGWWSFPNTRSLKECCHCKNCSVMCLCMYVCAYKANKKVSCKNTHKCRDGAVSH